MSKVEHRCADIGMECHNKPKPLTYVERLKRIIEGERARGYYWKGMYELATYRNDLYYRGLGNYSNIIEDAHRTVIENKVLALSLGINLETGASVFADVEHSEQQDHE